MDLCMDCNLLFAELKKHGFCLGFSTIEDVALSKEQVDYWHRGNFVCYVKSKGLIATYVCFITGDELKDEFSTYKSVQEHLNFTDTIETQRRPSIVEAFENILFTSYSDAVAKYKQMLAVFPKFTPAFKELFAEEMDALAVSNTSIQVKPDLSKIYINKEHEYCYISAVTPDSVCVKRLTAASFDKELYYRELQQYTAVPEVFDELRSLLLTVLHGLSSVIRINNLPEDNSVSLKYYNETDEFGDVTYTVVGQNIELRITDMLGASCYLSDKSCIHDSDNECHAYDIVDIFSANAKAKRIHDFLVELMKEFAPILAGDLALRKQLFDYLYTLEDGDNSVNAQQEFQNDTGIQYSPRQILIIDDVGQTLQEAADNNFSACTPMEVVNFMEDRQITIGGNLIENGIYQEN